MVRRLWYEREEIKRGLCPQCRAESAEVRVLELKAENATLREFVQALLAQLSEDYGDYEGELPRTIAQMFIDGDKLFPTTSIRPGTELNKRVAFEVAGQAIVRQYSTDIRDAMEFADILVRRLDPADVGLYSYPTILRTGHFGECWAASFDFNLDAMWYEYEHIEHYLFAARGESAAHALSLAMLKVAAAVKANLPRRVEERHDPPHP